MAGDTDRTARANFRLSAASAHGKRLILAERMGGRVVYGSGLENRRGFTLTGGSNPSPSAIRTDNTLIYIVIYRDMYIYPTKRGRDLIGKRVEFFIAFFYGPIARRL